MKNVKAIAVLCVFPVIFASCAAGSSDIGSVTSAPPPVKAMPLSTDILADSGVPVLELIAASCSASAFTDGKVSDRDIERILTSGTKAPSAKNAQPWHFTVIKNYETASGLLNQARDGNVIIVVSGKRDIATDTMQFDCGLATQNMQLAAESLGLGARIFIEPVHEIENQRGRLGIPEGYDVLVALLIGYVDDSIDTAVSATPRDMLSNHVNYAP